MQVKSKQSKKSFELLFLKSQECQGGCVKNASAMLKNKKGGQPPPPLRHNQHLCNMHIYIFIEKVNDVF